MKDEIQYEWVEEECNCYMMHPCLYCGGSGNITVKKPINPPIK